MDAEYHERWRRHHDLMRQHPQVKAVEAEIQEVIANVPDVAEWLFSYEGGEYQLKLVEARVRAGMESRKRKEASK